VSQANATTSWARFGKQLTRAALGIAAFALASSVSARPGLPNLAREPEPSRPHSTTQVVLVALDGVRFQDVFEGVDRALARRFGVRPERVVEATRLMPKLHALMSTHGAALGAPHTGSTISASGPHFVSLPGYSELLTGQRETGCRDNGCQGTLSATLADQIAALPGGNGSAVVTSWPDIERVAAHGDRVAISSGRHGGRTRALLARTPEARIALERAENEAPWPGHGDFRRDRFTAALALAHLREAHPTFLFVSLGEPDEFAHHGDYAGYLDSLQAADQQIDALWQALEERARMGVRTALLVTSDHGRSSNFRDHGQPHPESARVWLAAGGSAIGGRGHLSSPVARRLADVAPTLRALLHLPRDTSSVAGEPLTELLLLP
jgi:hypothetical protein